MPGVSQQRTSLTNIKNWSRIYSASNLFLHQIYSFPNLLPQILMIEAAFFNPATQLKTHPVDWTQLLTPVAIMVPTLYRKMVHSWPILEVCKEAMVVNITRANHLETDFVEYIPCPNILNLWIIEDCFSIGSEHSTRLAARTNQTSISSSILLQLACVFGCYRQEVLVLNLRLCNSSYGAVIDLTVQIYYKDLGKQI